MMQRHAALLSHLAIGQYTEFHANNFTRRVWEDFLGTPVNSESQAAESQKSIFKQTFPAEPDKHLALVIGLNRLEGSLA